VSNTHAPHRSLFRRTAAAAARAATVPDAALACLDDWLARPRRGRWRDTPTAVVLLLPAAMLLGVFGFFPILYAVYLSLYDLYYGTGPFVGVSNYARALTSRDFWGAFAVTSYYVIGTIPVSLALAFAIALMLYRLPWGRSVFRTVYFLPYVTSAVAAAMVWWFIFHPQSGLANALLRGLGLPTQRWLLEPRGVLHILSGGWFSADTGPSLALACVMAFDIWHGLGFMVVVFLAGLTAIPRELEEAAMIDGAGPLARARHVIVPLLSPTLFFLTIVSVIKSFQAFNSFYALTGNGRGPGNTTQNLTVLIYSTFYEYGRWGYGAAVATLLCTAIIALTLVQWRWFGRRVHYG